LPPVCDIVPGIPESPHRYAKFHPDRVKKFPGSEPRFFFDPDESQKSQRKRCRHELDHDAESVFWLLVYWAMSVQPEKPGLKEPIDSALWANLLGTFHHRQNFVEGLAKRPDNLTHSSYEPLQSLIKDLAAILVVDRHWLPASDPRSNPYYVNEAFQRLILSFMIDNKDEDFMRLKVDKMFREVEGRPQYNAKSITDSQARGSRDRSYHPSVEPLPISGIRRVCGSMNFCLLLLLCLRVCLQATDDLEMIDDADTGDDPNAGDDTNTGDDTNMGDDTNTGDDTEMVD
jgi:hypothetical protein